MKVKELLVELEHLPEDAEVIMSIDEEGNEYNPVDTVVYTRTIGEGYDLHVPHPDDWENGEYDPANAVFMVVLWP